jgi:hypothetical protein
MCDYTFIDVSIYSDIVNLSKCVVNEFLLEKFAKKNKLVRKYVDKYSTVNCFGLCEKDTLVIDGTLYDNLIKSASSILDSNGYKTYVSEDDDDDYEPSIEIIYIDSDNHVIESEFGIHCDNDAYQYKKVQTLILYYHVDCDGGELEIYKDKGMFKGYKLEDTIETKTDDFTKRRIVMMSGKTYHYPKKVYNGKRIAFVYNINARK